MKSFAVLVSLFVSSFALAASPEQLIQALQQAPVAKHAAELRDQGFHLVQITDLHAQSGRFPRCPCSSYTFEFVKHDVVNGAAVKTVRNFSVNLVGFGENLTVSIQENAQ